MCREVKRHLLIGLSVCALLGAIRSPLEAGEAAIEISHRARSLQPGEVVLLTVSADQPIQSIRCNAFGKTFPFFPSSVLNKWNGFVGIDLNVKSGIYTIEMRILTPLGPAVESYDIRIDDKEFPVRRLTVDEKYVTPPQAALDRIREESAQVKALFRQVSPERLWFGPFIRPVEGEVISVFGKRNILNGQPRSPHSGADFRAAEGTPIVTPNGGRVVLTKELYFAGNTVIIDHGLGLYSYFAHLSEIRVHPNDLLRKGDILGLVGATGRVTGAHLHWTVRLVESRVDPLALMEISENVQGGDANSSR